MNKVILIGNVGQDPNVRYVDNGICVAQFRLATSERGYTLQNGTQVPDRTEWHNLVFWKGIAERVERYVHKGMRICVEGKLRTRNFETRDGQQKSVTEVVVENMEILSPIHRDQPNGQGGYQNGYQNGQGGYQQNNQGGYPGGYQGGYQQPAEQPAESPFTADEGPSESAPF